MAKKLYCAVRFGESAWLGGGKIVNSIEQADMFGDMGAAHDGVEEWRDNHTDTADSDTIAFSVVFLAVRVPEETVALADGLG